MKNRAFSVLVVAAAGIFRPALAEAQTVLTPSELASAPPYSIIDFSVSQADSSIAFSVFTFPTQPPPQTLPVAINIWTVPRHGTSGQPVTTFADKSVAIAGKPAWNQDQFIAYIVDRPQGGNLLPLDQIVVTDFGAISPAELHVQSFSWSLDPSNLVFSAVDDAHFAKDLAPNALYTISIRGIGLKRILDCSPHACGGPQWSPTDNVIAYGQNRTIGLVNPDGSGAHIILTNAGSPTWSPNTGRLAFSCGTTGDDVCVANEDGSGSVNLSNGLSGLSFSEPSWSFDESLIAMIGRPPASGVPGSLYVVASNGGTPVQLTTSGSANPQWSPLIDEIFYICRRGSLPSQPENDDLCVLQHVGAPPSGCDPTTCRGCCSQGICLPGTFTSACGLNGASCVACTGGQVCSANGTCGNPTTCDITNCDGCCDSSNICHAGTNVLACGKGAGRCARCGNSEICDVDQRICLTQLCSAANCTGCCGADGKCQAGNADSTCGANGFACATCSGGAHCNTNHACEVHGCNIGTCPTGCCDVNGNCNPGNTATSCGYGGFACASCGSQVCDQNSRTCTAPQPCSSNNCSGCCGPGDNQCYPGNTPAACGFGGFTCEVCGPTEICVPTAGFCQ